MAGLLLHHPGLVPEVSKLGQLDVCVFFFFTNLDRRLSTVSPEARLLGQLWFACCCLLSVSNGCLGGTLSRQGGRGWTGSASLLHRTYVDGASFRAEWQLSVNGIC